MFDKNFKTFFLIQQYTKTLFRKDGCQILTRRILLSSSNKYKLNLNFINNILKSNKKYKAILLKY